MIRVGVVFLGLLVFGVPIAYVMGVSSFSYFFFFDRLNVLSVMPERIFDGMDKFTLMAIPLFMLTGELMNHSGITNRLVSFAQYLVGRFRGGLGHVNIFASLIFAGMSGTAIGDVSALGTIFIPAMVDRGYSPKYAAAITAASSVVGPIIPPSIITVIYGGVTGTSIGALFAGAIIPGILISVSNFLYNFYISGRRNYPVETVPFNLKQFSRSLNAAILALITPIIIVGGILFGVFTPTEAGGIAVLYSLFLGFVVFRTVKLRHLFSILSEAVLKSCSLFLIIAVASMLSWIMGREQLPGKLGELLLGMSADPRLILLFVNVLFLFLGTWLDLGTAVILLAPILAPALANIGVHPVHLGIVMIVNLNLGVCTPPLGVCLFAAGGIAKVKLEEISIEILPFVLLEVAVLFLITYVPELVLTIPRMAGLL